MRKVCVVTGSRAEYGLMQRLMHMLQDSPLVDMQLVVTNMHLSPKYGETYKEIEADGFTIAKKVPIINEDAEDCADTTLKSMARGIEGFSQAYIELQPDLVCFLGDRYEMLSAAIAAMIHRIPIAHIGGGTVTEGAYDDAIRHSITKMSQLHFASTEIYCKRIIQMGENPERVFCMGSPGIENIKTLPLKSKEEIEADLKFQIDENTILVTYHPVTLGNHTVEQDITDFISALEEKPQLRVIFTMPNSDTGSQTIVNAINNFVSTHRERASAYKSLGVVRYLSVMRQVAAVVGNSSSGIVEVPSFGKPTLDIGDRQKGRIAADSIYHCETDKCSILKGLDVVLSGEFRSKASKTVNPYEKPNTAKIMFDVISTFPLEKLGQKHFYDLPV